MSPFHLLNVAGQDGLYCLMAISLVQLLYNA